MLCEISKRKQTHIDIQQILCLALKVLKIQFQQYSDQSLLNQEQIYFKSVGQQQKGLLCFNILTQSSTRLVNLLWSFQIKAEDQLKLLTSCQYSTRKSLGFQIKLKYSCEKDNLINQLKKINESFKLSNLRFYLNKQNRIVLVSQIKFFWQGSTQHLIKKSLVLQFSEMRNQLNRKLPFLLQYLTQNYQLFFPLNYKKQNKKIKMNSNIQSQNEKSRKKQLFNITLQNVQQNNVLINMKKTIQQNKKTKRQQSYKLAYLRMITDKTSSSENIQNQKNNQEEQLNQNQNQSNVQKEFSIKNYSSSKFISQLSKSNEIISFASSQTQKSKKTIINIIKKIMQRTLMQQQIQAEFKKLSQQGIFIKNLKTVTFEQNKLKKNYPINIQYQYKETSLLNKLSISKTHIKYAQQIQTLLKIQQKVKRIPKKIVNGFTSTQDSQKLQKISHGTFATIQRSLNYFNFELTINPFHLRSPQIDQATKLFSQNNNQRYKFQSYLIEKKPNIPQSLQWFLRIIRLNCFYNQQNILKLIRDDYCPYIGKYYLNTESPQIIPKRVFMQYYKLNLYQLVQKQKQGRISIKINDKISILNDIIKGILFLQTRFIVHRDLKLSNVMISKDLQAKIIDFGSACFFYNNPLQYKSLNQHLFSTQGYYIEYKNLPQEVKSKYSAVQYNQNKNFDIYSFGAIIYKLCQQQLNKGSKIIDIQVKNNLIFLINKCREIDPDKRISPIQILMILKYLKDYLNISNSNNDLNLKTIGTVNEKLISNIQRFKSKAN